MFLVELISTYYQRSKKPKKYTECCLLVLQIEKKIDIYRANQKFNILIRHRYCIMYELEFCLLYSIAHQLLKI